MIYILGTKFYKMFTGIIQNLGEIKNFDNGVLEISTNLDISDCAIGSSICCNGVCLTATDIIQKNESFIFKANVGEETQNRTNFSKNLNDRLNKINLEKSLKIGDEISGHFVYGHIDRITNISNINKLENSWEFEFTNFLDKDSKFVVEKGSITINGISLTISKVNKKYFSISVIPHTFDQTNLKFNKINDFVNIEFDYLARFAVNSISS